MSDNVANGNVEDVLSSIKRLVSEEGRKIPDIMQSTRARKPGRLVLTDSLRVSESQGDKETPSDANVSGYAAEVSVKPMVLRASDAVKENEPRIEEPTERVNDPVESLSSKIEALEAAIAKTEDQWEPDGEGQDAYAGTMTQSLSWQAEADEDEADAADAPLVSETKATFIRDPKVTAQADPVQDVKSERTPLDEDALRDLIAQVVREELQGVLGERITRNVRKLVRREIYRALAEHKPD
ncbi:MULTISPECIES: hypothetical protein [unclassified Ruegeria]|uniref:hypothetical protein n=1 Tax=unclassified Ruegeria TaxID=2625375 RepID=UPI001ADD24AB|nr:MULTISPECIES: hypothetical protein [unclassified Ruegeria]MBO9410242.1 hypothetical protein [Ruegeria sp. R8_1]MBO9414539.1 hypothetical protein [Ruegeria sp. R8_2]